MNFGNNKSSFFLVLIIILSSIYILEKKPKYNTELLKKLNLENYRHIAHAGGGIDNHTYTNSKEAVNESIKKGFKLIEIDLLETKDKAFIGAHDWKSFDKITRNKNKDYLLKNLEELKIFERYSILTTYEINKIFINNNKIFFITDKTENFKKLNSDFQSIKKRMIVEIFSKERFKDAVKEKIYNPMYKYNTGDYKFVVRNNIKIVSASIKQILKNKQEFEKLIKKKIYVFAYTSSEDKIINKYNGKLFTHIYTDFWDLKQMRCSVKKIDLCKTY